MPIIQFILYIPKLTPNAPVLIECKTLCTVVASAAEVDTDRHFYNGQTNIYIRRLLESLGYHQPPTPLKTDNRTVNAFINKSLCQKKSKLWDLKFHWLWDKQQQKHVCIFWDKRN